MSQKHNRPMHYRAAQYSDSESEETPINKKVKTENPVMANKLQRIQKKKQAVSELMKMIIQTMVEINIRLQEILDEDL